MVDPNHTPQDRQDDSRGPGALVFTGEAIRNLSPEQVAAIGDAASRVFGIEMQAVPSLEQYRSARPEQGEGLPPVPATLRDFREYAKQHGYASKRAVGAWNLIIQVGWTAWRTRDDENFPGVRFIGPSPAEDGVREEQVIVDLRSVKERLATSHRSYIAWARDVRPTVMSFLEEITDAMVPDPE